MTSSHAAAPKDGATLEVCGRSLPMDIQHTFRPKSMATLTPVALHLATRESEVAAGHRRGVVHGVCAVFGLFSLNRLFISGTHLVRLNAINLDILEARQLRSAMLEDCVASAAMLAVSGFFLTRNLKPKPAKDIEMDEFVSVHVKVTELDEALQRLEQDAREVEAARCSGAALPRRALDKWLSGVVYVPQNKSRWMAVRMG